MLEQVGSQKPENLAKYVGLVLDEMYVKESLVYDKHTGSLTGYSDMGDVNNLFVELEKEKKIQFPGNLSPNVFWCSWSGGYLTA